MGDVLHTHTGYDNFSYEIREDNNAEPYLATERLDVDFAYTTTDRFEEDFSVKDVLLLKDAVGKGWGWDFGMIYEYRPAAKENSQAGEGKLRPYKIRLGIALTDLGKIHYQGEQAMRHYRFSWESQLIYPESLIEYNAATPDEQLIETFNIQPAEKLNAYETYLPASLGLNIDARLAGPLYFNLGWRRNLNDEAKAGLQQNTLGIS